MAVDKVPPGPKPIPLLGNLMDVGANPLRFFETCVETYGPVVRVRLDKSRDTYILSRPTDIQYVLQNTQRQFSKGYAGDRILSLVLGNGLVTSEGSFWLRQRRLSQPAFHHHRIANYANIMTEFTQRMLDTWQDGDTRDIHEDMMQCTMEIVGKTLFDVDLKPEVDGSNPVGRALDQVLHEYVHQFTSVTRRLMEMLPISLPLPGNTKLMKSVERLDQIIYGIIDRRRDDNLDHGDLLSMLLMARDDDGTGMSREQLRDEVMTLFLAGHETTANLLSWTLYALAHHPEVEGKLLQELESELQGRTPVFSDIPRLCYTEAIIKESMRLYPPVWYISREPVEDVWIDDYCLPAGCEIGLSQWVMHRHPEYFDDPASFVPDRWSPEFEKSLPPYVYFPFGAGPRVCIGNNFAMMEAVLLLAGIMQKFHFQLDERHAVILEPSITLRPKKGIHMRVIKR